MSMVLQKMKVKYNVCLWIGKIVMGLQFIK